MSDRAPRFCPQCDAQTVEPLCPTDGATTLMCDPPHFDLDRDAQIGLVVANRYRLAKELGRGGFGAVFSAQHTGTGQQVAIKLLSAQGDLQQQKRFFREARVTAALKSRHTIRVMDFGQDDLGLSYLAMELLTGRTLDAWLNERHSTGQALTEYEAVEVGIAVCKSLGEAHAAGLVHRDMKPQNLFCATTEDGPTIKVLDFGIVKVNDQSMTGDSIIGTTNYMSPEQAMSQKLDGRSDLYSLGVVLYELVSCRLPFESETPVQTLVAHIQQAPPPLAERARSPLSPEFLQIIDNLLSKKPEERFANAAALLAALTDLLPHAGRELGPSRGPSGSHGAGVNDETAASTALTAGRLGTPPSAGLTPARPASSHANPSAAVGSATTVVSAGAAPAGKRPAFALWLGLGAVALGLVALGLVMSGPSAPTKGMVAAVPAAVADPGQPVAAPVAAAVPAAAAPPALPQPAPAVAVAAPPSVVAAPAVEPPSAQLAAPAAPAPAAAPASEPAADKTGRVRPSAPKKGGNALHRDL